MNVLSPKLNYDMKISSFRADEALARSRQLHLEIELRKARGKEESDCKLAKGLRESLKVAP